MPRPARTRSSARYSASCFGEIQTYANAQGFDLVLGDGVLFAKAPLDITAAVLAQLQTKPTTLPASPPKSSDAPGIGAEADRQPQIAR